MIHYSTLPPTTRAGWRRSLATAVSVVLHLALLLLIVRVTTQARERQAQTGDREQVQNIPLTFLPPKPTPTPRPPTQETPPSTPVQPPPAPLAPGPDRDPGTQARVTPDPEQDPNAPPRTTPEAATRPVPTDDEAGGTPRSERTGAPPSSLDPTAAPTPAPPNDTRATGTQESEARRLFGPGPTRLGPVSGSRDNRPWESALQMPSRGCTLPAESGDSTLPPGMAMVAGKILNQDNGRPLAGARLQILGTGFGTFSDESGDYRLIFDRTLVDLCRTQSVRVTAPGYHSRDVILYVGAPLSSDVPLSRY